MRSLRENRHISMRYNNAIIVLIVSEKYLLNEFVENFYIGSQIFRLSTILAYANWQLLKIYDFYQ